MNKATRSLVFIIHYSLFIIPFSFCYSQSATIFGTVKDSLNKPVSGASIGVFGKPLGTTTDEKGKYSLTVPSHEQLKIVFSFTGLARDSAMVQLKDGEQKEVNSELKGNVHEIRTVIIEDQSMKDINMTKINPKVVSVLPTPNQSVEDILKTMPGVSSANELTSNYNVRGGNYDENLIYVNDVEIYRPLLVSTGQQEGLSFINPDMVDGLSFSAGGFDAIYGDKMSSVLDVRYRKPTSFGYAVSGSLLGGSLEMEDISSNKKWTIIGGIRYKSNAYLLNTLDTKGEYQPNFIDGQFLATYEFNKKFSVELLGNYSRNVYNLTPETRETNFGTVTNAQRFTVYFDGKEADSYESETGAASFIYKPSDKVKLKLIVSGYNTDEYQNFDILGQYFLDQLQADLGKPNFGNVLFNLGVGSFLDHARDQFHQSVYAVEHKGEWVGERTLFQWGVKVQHEQTSESMNEWYYLDSAGYSIPSARDSANPQITLNDVVNSDTSFGVNRIMGYVQNTWQISDINKTTLTTGVRANYNDLNNQLVISPRMSLSYKPRGKKALSYKFSTGYYYQPPSFRELIDLNGVVHTDVKAQESIHFVLGADYNFLWMGRKFKLTAEAYYKILNNLNPYEIQDIRIRYLANNDAVGYARGMDFRLFGDFVPGVESWASVSILQTQQLIKNDSYYLRLNAEGDTIITGYTYDQKAVDSIKVTPGYIPRPTDQLVNFGMFFQDYFPKNPTYKMQLSLLFGTALPFGPPGPALYQDVLRGPTYRRVDIGFSKQIIGKGVKHPPNSKLLRKFEAVWVTLEVFNLLQASNVSSYIWITDVTDAQQYAVPNYLTGRELNLKLNLKF